MKHYLPPNAGDYLLVPHQNLPEHVLRMFSVYKIMWWEELADGFEPKSIPVGFFYDSESFVELPEGYGRKVPCETAGINRHFQLANIADQCDEELGDNYLLINVSPMGGLTENVVNISAIIDDYLLNPEPAPAEPQSQDEAAEKAE
ncbi:hypothetical protein EAN04_24670 [Salmonella enterica]|nr:hypothetical protein [Salmonella enterica]